MASQPSGNVQPPALPGVWRLIARIPSAVTPGIAGGCLAFATGWLLVATNVFAQALAPAAPSLGPAGATAYPDTGYQQFTAPTSPSQQFGQSSIGSPPTMPVESTRPRGWAGGDGMSMKMPERVDELNPAGSLDQEAKIKEQNPHFYRAALPEKMNGAEVVARIGSEVVLASDILPPVNERINGAIAAGQLPEAEVPKVRTMLMKQQMQKIVDTKLLMVEARRKIPKDNIPKIEKRVRESFEKERIPKLIDGVNVKNRADLADQLAKNGSSIDALQRGYFEQAMAGQWLRQQTGDEKEVTHAQMEAYYNEHIKEYEVLARAKWEHLSAKFANYENKQEAYNKLASWGNLVFRGQLPFAEVAKRHSDDYSSADGGLHDWTEQGALASKPLDAAIFALPLNQLSAIIEDERGYHIVRVTVREDATRIPFADKQPEIKKKITEERENKAMNDYLVELRKRVPVWTVFDDEEPTEEVAKKQNENATR